MALQVQHRRRQGMNNRAENSHLRTRRRWRIVKRFKSPRQAQRFLSIPDQLANLLHFVCPAQSITRTANARRTHRAQAIAAWRELTGAATDA